VKTRRAEKPIQHKFLFALTDTDYHALKLLRRRLKRRERKEKERKGREGREGEAGSVPRQATKGH